MQTKKDDPIAPIFNSEEAYEKVGLTKKEYFAAMALQGVLAKGIISIEYAAQYAVQQADQLIIELNKNDSNAI